MLRISKVWEEVLLILIKHILDVGSSMQGGGFQSVKIFNWRLIEDYNKVKIFSDWKELSIYNLMRLLYFKKGTGADPWILQLVFIAI